MKLKPVCYAVSTTIISCLISPTCLAQERFEDNVKIIHPHAENLGHAFKANYSGHHSYDVIEYELFMDWYNVILGMSNSYSGIMQIKFLPDLVSPLNKIDVDNDTTYLHGDSAFSGGKMLTLNNAGLKLNITLDRNYGSGDTGIVTLYYHVVDQPANLQRGFYYYFAGEQLTPTYTVPHTIAYTMSEPSDAHDWMPCYDDPSDKALCEVSIRVPDGYVAASNGTLSSRIDNHDGSTTFNWSENYPIATYLMCATAAQFSIVRRNFIKSDGDAIPIQYYVFPEDSSGAVSSSECNIDTVASMIGFYESLYGTFPFDKYGMTGIEPFGYGGMEHQTITTLLRKYEFNRKVVAHELAHQWWGDMVTLGTWNDIWLNEGFATYSEAMQLQQLSQAAFENEMEFYASQFFVEDSQIRYAVFEPPPGYIFGLAEYYKGAWVLNMMRNIVGDSAFFAIFKTYRAEFRYGNAVSTDFENVVNQTTHTDMSWFFNEWIFQAGYPVYSQYFGGAGDTLLVTVVQNQDTTTAPVFKMPLDVGVYSLGILRVFTVVDSLRSQAFKFYFRGQVDSVVLDPGEKILGVFSNARSTKVGESLVPPGGCLLFWNYPNPFNGQTDLVYNLPSADHVTMELYDVLGRKVKTLEDGFQAAGIHKIILNASDLATGVYICKMTSDFGNRAIKLLLEK